MTADVYIRRVADGMVRVYREDPWHPPEGESIGSIYLWEDGNYSCDCNRHLFFQRAGGELGIHEIEEVPCNTSPADRKYVVDKIVVGGEVVYQDEAVTSPVPA